MNRTDHYENGWIFEGKARKLPSVLPGILKILPFSLNSIWGETL